METKETDIVSDFMDDENSEGLENLTKEEKLDIICLYSYKTYKQMELIHGLLILVCIVIAFGFGFDFLIGFFIEGD